MPPEEQRSRFDPVILVALGIGILTFAIVMFVFQNQFESGVAADTNTSSAGQIFIAFITGLTTGGLSCLAVQGGLLASSMAHQIEQDYLDQSVQQKPRSKKHGPAQVKIRGSWVQSFGYPSYYVACITSLSGYVRQTPVLFAMVMTKQF